MTYSGYMYIEVKGKYKTYQKIEIEHVTFSEFSKIVRTCVDDVINVVDVHIILDK